MSVTTVNDKTEIIAGNKLTTSRTTATSTSTSLEEQNHQKYQPRTSNDVLLADLQFKRNLVASNTHLHNNNNNNHAADDNNEPPVHHHQQNYRKQFTSLPDNDDSLVLHSTIQNDNDEINSSMLNNNNKHNSGNSSSHKISQQNTKNQIFVISSNQMSTDSGQSSPVNHDGNTQINSNISSTSSPVLDNVDATNFDDNDCRKTASPIGVATVSSTTTTASNNHIDDTIIENMNNNNNSKNNDFHPYVNSTANPSTANPSTANPSTANPSTTGSMTKNGSTGKLLPASDDQSSKQSKCSVLRSVIFCICLNITYANIVRFPRELEQNGLAFIIPYFVLLILVGMPITLLEISVGQFLGQGSANSWRSSPILKGACMISRFASWIASLWISLQAMVAVLYIGMLIFKSIPFTGCARQLKIEENHYKAYADNGQDCILKTFLTPVWNDGFYFGILIAILLVIWLIAMLCTHNSKVFRRSVICFGLFGLMMLIALTGWEVYNSLEKNYFPELWPFDEMKLVNSSLWFNALMQVIYSTNIGFGIMPVVTGKFLYKGDAVRTAVVYICFNLLINAIAVTLFMVQYDNKITQGAITTLPELKSLTTIYDKILIDYGNRGITMVQIVLGKIIACLILSLIVISAIISITISIYTSSRLIPRHPNYILSFVALSSSVAMLVVPGFALPRILDSRVVGTLVITALVFDLIATIWIYGTKNIYIDLEFSIGRPIFKSWLYLWCIAPVILTGVLLWWCVDDDQYDVLYQYVPRWAPIAFVMLIIFIVAGIEIFKQVDYNFFGMICEAAKPAKEWGPADPLARHTWKQWRTVCQDTGERDFTLRRRGTRDYTRSIMKEPYTNSARKYILPIQHWKQSSTPGNSSPNCSGSVFGDSSIEEDFCIDKYSVGSQNFVPYNENNQVRRSDTSKHMRYSNRARRITQEKLKNRQTMVTTTSNPDKTNRDILYVYRVSNEQGNNVAKNNPTRIEITPSVDSITYANEIPMARTNSYVSISDHNIYKDNMNPSNELVRQYKSGGTNSLDHICWRKLSVDSNEYATEL